MIPTMTNRQRDNLTILAEFLETKVSPKQFDIRKFVGSEWDGNPNLSCGTTACALGWATTIPKLREQGLRLARCGYGAIPVLEKYINVPYYNNMLLSCQELFGINRRVITQLFIPSAVINGKDYYGRILPETAKPTDVAQAIRYYLEYGNLDNYEV